MLKYNSNLAISKVFRRTMNFKSMNFSISSHCSFPLPSDVLRRIPLHTPTTIEYPLSSLRVRQLLLRPVWIAPSQFGGSSHHFLRPKTAVLAASLMSTQVKPNPQTLVEVESPSYSTTSTCATWLMIVESPAKATTIAKYVGPTHLVLASYGHVRDLAAKNGSVLPENDFEMKWIVSGPSKDRLAAMANALKGCRGLVLATDPDREGEAIAWHIVDSLRQQGKLTDETPVQRVCFSEITPSAVMHALKHPRQLSMPLVEAYMARRALDYLLGFALSPVLWRKLPGCRSAGRVQSVALRLICDREIEREQFSKQEYWSVHCEVGTEAGALFQADLSVMDGARLSDRILASCTDAEQSVQRVLSCPSWTVGSVKAGRMERSPSAPFTTSTLQQEASAKLGFGAARTMAIAQKLYEGVGTHGGLITYMRTDSTQISSQAVASIRQAAADRFGAGSVAPQPRVFQKKAKNAQEAHEAIRPTSPATFPASLEGYLDKSELALYSLIWARTVASQMANAIYDQVAVDISSLDGTLVLHTAASHLKDKGHLAAYQSLVATSSSLLADNENEDAELDTPGRVFEGLRRLQKGQSVLVRSCSSRQHSTEPPPRFTQGTLVKQLEDVGVGRPSTYASTINTLLTRSYVRMERRRLVPEIRGRMVTAFLTSFFTQYVDPTFTASMEEQLDSISEGSMAWRTLLSQFWTPFQRATQDAAALQIEHVSQSLQSGLHSFLGVSEEASTCPKCLQGRLHIRVSSRGSGLFLGCSNYPTCEYKAGIGSNGVVQGDSGEKRDLGVDPASGKSVCVCYGPYGPYLDVSLAGQRVGRISIPKEMDASLMTLSDAIPLLAGGTVLGAHPAGGDVALSRGPYGWYIAHGSLKAALPKGVGEQDVTLALALSLLEKKAARNSAKSKKAMSSMASGQPLEGKEKKEKEKKEKKERKEKEKKEKPSKESKVGKEKDLPEVLALSPELGDFLGGVKSMSRSDAVKSVWGYIKAANLQDPSDGRRAFLDERLEKLLGVKEVTCIGLRAKLARHFQKVA